MAAGAVDHGQALKRVVDLVPPEGELHGLAFQRAAALEEADAVLVEDHAANG
jgi:hypothetical protein